MEVIEGQSHHPNSSPGFPPRIGVRGMLSTGGATSWESIPDRSPGHAFMAIAHAGWRRHTKV